ncbi:hypothetical protein KXD93_25595 [Mucilaginibacter sp. BJC16-A38]|uniref:hypothetical protein n=1 Tax=Mucilaginibacter phenanthrenivorans TaxID=1234842 RepID=UPI0021581C9A|nr:hypothetical protein [Mucilaginibacter phenanthrenivorans]MCR8561057.1 hypothetical protein [Mucilaginibacter phenanthrenivorans]
MKKIDFGFYILDTDGNPKKVDDTVEWKKWYKKIENRRVLTTTIGNIRISTVFLALDFSQSDRNSTKEQLPILYETAMFDGPVEIEIFRWKTKAKAIEGHKKIIAKIEQK